MHTDYSKLSAADPKKDAEMQDKFERARREENERQQREQFNSEVKGQKKFESMEDHDNKVVGPSA